MSSSDTILIQSCPNKAPLQVNSCKLCIIHLPCACSLKGTSFFIPPTLENCNGLATPMINHSLNLTALFHFYQPKANLYNLTAKSFFSKPVIPQIPEVNILTSQFDEVVQREQSTKLSLKQIAKNIKAKRKLYSDKTSKLTSDLGIMTKPKISNSVTFVSFINLVLVIIAQALSTNVYCKLLVLVRSANALDFLFSTTPQPQSNSTNLTPYYLLILLTVTCFIVFCLIFVYIKMRTTNMLDKRVYHIQRLAWHSSEQMTLLPLICLILVKWPKI